jgi:hypothetical protein
MVSLGLATSISPISIPILFKRSIAGSITPVIYRILPATATKAVTIRVGTMYRGDKAITAKVAADARSDVALAKAAVTAVTIATLLEYRASAAPTEIMMSRFFEREVHCVNDFRRDSHLLIYFFESLFEAVEVCCPGLADCWLKSGS